MQKTHKVILISLLLVVYCFAFQGKRGLFEPDEGRYSAVALQMIKSNDWMHPRTHPEHEHWTKPPLTYWAIASSILMFGKNEFAVRFPNALSFLIVIVSSFYLGKVFVPKRPWVVSLIFGTFLFPATMCNGATTDYPVTMWETLAVCFFANAYWRENNYKQLILICLMWATFGLAFLTKGPPSLLPLFSIIIFLQFKCVKDQHFNMRWMSGISIMLLVGGSWFFVVISQKPELFQYFIWDEIVLRVFTGHHERHSEWYASLYIYFPILVFGTLPWSYYVGKGFIRSFKKAKKSNSSDLEENSIKCLFLILWFIIPLALFITSKSNLPLYVLPLFVPLAVITAIGIEELNVSLHKVRYGIVLWCIAIVLLRVFMGFINFKKDSSKFAEEIKTKYSGSVEELVFVNTRPALGLQFYTGSVIERVSFKFSDLEDELKGKESRLWFVLQGEEGQFRNKMRVLNVTMRELGSIEAWRDYVLFEEINGKI